MTSTIAAAGWTAFAYAIAARIAARNTLRIHFGAAPVVLAAIAIASTLRSPDNAYAFLAATCAISAITDLSTGYVFDAVTLPSLAVIALTQLQQGRLGFAAAGCCAAAGALVVVFVLWRGRGLGLGDVKLGACIGAALGAARALTALEYAFIAGALYAVPVLLTRRASLKTAVPFAPFLAAGTFLCVCLDGGP